jgi:hypothetical protein
MPAKLTYQQMETYFAPYDDAHLSDPQPWILITLGLAAASGAGLSVIEQEETMKRRIVLVAALLTVLGAVFGASASAAQAATTQPQSASTDYIIHNVKLGCIADPGHGNVVYVRFTCTTYVNFIDPVTEYGYTWYLIEMNGDPNTCLNYVPSSFYVGADSCVPNDPNELWEHHEAYELVNQTVTLATGYGQLMTCNDTGNSALIAYPLLPARCHFTSSVQYSWEIDAG